MDDPYYEQSHQKLWTVACISKHGKWEDLAEGYVVFMSKRKAVAHARALAAEMPTGTAYKMELHVMETAVIYEGVSNVRHFKPTD